MAASSRQQKAEPTYNPADEEPIRKELAARYEKVNFFLKKAEDKLRRYMLPESVWYCYSSWSPDPRAPELGLYFGFAKCKNEWRLCHGEDEFNHEQDIEKALTPVAECTLDIRNACVEHYPKLLARVQQKAKETIPLLDATIEKWSKILG